MEHIIWTEKYRPKEFSDIKGQDAIVARIKAFVEQKNMPHVLFVGPAGIGKTSLSLVIAKQLFGDSWRSNILELNASDERGIDVVRNKVKDFARTKALGDVPFKIIYLDECDALTRDAQQALRRTMENYTQTCRFILSANYSSKIMDPIQSRCAIFRFRPLSKEHVFEIVDKIAANEGINCPQDAKEALYEVTLGDCRKLENLMQSCASITKDFTSELVFELASVANPDEVKGILQDAMKGEFTKARKDLLNTMLKYSLSGLDIIKQIQKEVWNLDLDGRKKVHLVDKCGEIEFRMVEGADDYVQLEALLAQFVLAAE